LIHESGLSFTTSTTQGVGIGTGLLVGRGVSQGTQMTALSARAAPPWRRQYGAQVALAIGAALAAVAFSIPALWIGVVVFGAAAVVSMRWNATVWPHLYAMWDRRFLCERCGSVCEPIESSRAQVDLAGAAFPALPPSRR